MEEEWRARRVERRRVGNGRLKKAKVEISKS